MSKEDFLKIAKGDRLSYHSHRGWVEVTISDVYDVDGLRFVYGHSDDAKHGCTINEEFPHLFKSLGVGEAHPANDQGQDK